jgi:hypothetical protein
MTESTDRPDLRERYTSAINATDLSLVDRRAGAADMLAAVGISNVLGSVLMRLATEFDQVKGEHGIAEAEARRVREVISALQAAARKEERSMDRGPTRAALYYRQADEQRAQAQRAETTAMALILMHLKTLREAKNALGLYAIGMATRRRHMLDDRKVLALTGHVLLAWLNQVCGSCGGSGRIGAYGERRVKCRACKGSGKTTASLGHNITEQVFCADLLRDIQDKAGHGAARDINQNKKAVRLGKERIAADLARTG